jgi:hypothetical protein
MKKAEGIPLRSPMPKVGFEPTRGRPQRFLRPPRLPFRHFGNTMLDYTASDAPLSIRYASRERPRRYRTTGASTFVQPLPK